MNKQGANEFVSLLKKNKLNFNAKELSLPELVEAANNNGYKCTVDELSNALWKMF